MTTEDKPREELCAEIESLRSRLEEAQQILSAIGRGEVDAFVVPGHDGDRLYTLNTADRPYRLLVETMNEGAATLAGDGTILYCNHRLSVMLETSLEQLIGAQFVTYVIPSHQPILIAQLEKSSQERIANEIIMRTDKNNHLPVLVSTSVYTLSGTRELSLVVTDIAQQKSLKLLEGILQTAMDGFLLLNADKYIQDVNDSYCQMSGYSRQELVGMYIKELEAIDSEEVIVGRGKKIAECGGDIFDSQHRRKDGSIFHVGVSIMFLSLDGGLFAVFVRDITERKLAEMELQQSKAMLQAAMDCSPAGIAIAEAPNGTLRYVNDAGLFMRGADRQSAVNGVGIDEYVKRWKLFDLDGRELRIEEVPLARAIMFGEENSREFIIHRAEGDDRIVFANAAPVRDESGTVTSGIVVFTDITERKNAENSLAEAKAFTENALNTITDIFYSFDLNGRFLSWNKTFSRISGYSDQELSLLKSADFFQGDDIQRIADAVERIFQDGSSTEEAFFVTKDGRKIPCEFSGSILRDSNDNIIGFSGIGRDITERIHAEEDKIKLESQLYQAQKMESIGRLAGGVAHDFNNMLTVILGHTALGLMHLDRTHPVCADLIEISKSAERSADLTRQLLAFARKQTVAPKVLNLNDTVSDMLKMLQRLIGENIHLTWQPAPGLWQVRVDPSQIDQILANLCVNSRDAIDGTGSITIETTNSTIDAEYCFCNPEATPGEYVCLTISDSGSGMNKETMAHIFEPFYTTKELGKGTGLGLATVYGAVKQNNGFINIYSEPGQGTTFSIYLPRDESSQTLPGTVAAPVLRGQETILLVEDEPAILNVASIMLEKQGYTVLKANTPGEAVRLAREHFGEIQLLMTDVIMPEMNGRDLAKNLLSIYPNMKRLFMSGYTADVIANHGVLEEGVYFIQKPFSLPNMAAKVREALDSK